MSKCRTRPAALKLGRAAGTPRLRRSAIRMQHQEQNPKYWRQWLQQQGVTEAVSQRVGEFYRALRDAHRRMWAFAYVGATAGATVSVLIAALLFRRAGGHESGSLPIALVALGAALGASLAWWGIYWFMHRPRLRKMLSLLTGRELQGDDHYAEGVVQSVADGLAKSQFRSGDDPSELSQLTRATIMTGLREAPVSELERSLLERLVGSAYVPTFDGGIFVCKVGSSCTRCKAPTRTGPLRLLQVPGHWAAANGFQRLKDLPARGQHLRVVPARTQELTRFLGDHAASAERPMFFGLKADVLLCETCAKEAVRLGLLQNRDR
jgi:hypothetical protein